jgi:acetyltransferase-like isoleucine patch superfamily enzyme
MKIINIIVALLPWPIKRWILVQFYLYNLHPKSYIGLSYIFPKNLIMEEGSQIGHLNLAIHLEKMLLKRGARIGRGNWITGFPIKSSTKHFAHQKDRVPELLLGEESAITKNHHIDCTNRISIGAFTTIAGYQSQFLTHSINIEKGIQDSYPINIGNYCFIGTNVVVLGGANLPSYAVLGAKSLLNNHFETEYRLYGGVPAKEIKSISNSAQYFKRTTGFVS